MYKRQELHRMFACRSYQRMKSSVFSRCLNVLSVAADVTETGRLFHTRAAATGKARTMMEMIIGVLGITLLFMAMLKVENCS